MTPFLFIIIEVNRGPGMIPKVNGCWHQDHKKKQKKQKKLRLGIYQTKENCRRPLGYSPQQRVMSIQKRLLGKKPRV